MKNLSLKSKLISTFLIVGLLPIICVGIYSYFKSSNTLEKAAIEKLVAVKNIKGEAVKRYFGTIRNQILTFSGNVSTVEAMKHFKEEFHTYRNDADVSKVDIIVYKEKLKNFYANEFGKKYLEENGKSIDIDNLLGQLSDTEIALQYQYIAKNPNPLGSKETLDYASDGSRYSKTHSIYHPSIRDFLQKFGYYDIFLVDIKSGDIVYSVFKELDYATSLKTGPYSNTNFAEAFNKAKDLSTVGSYVIVDYKKYSPSYESPASFIAAPIWDEGKKVGVAVFQMPIDRLNAIMSERSGMGKTGETYLFGPDKLMRSDSFLDSKNFNVVSSFKNPEKGTLSGEPVEEVLKGRTDYKISTNYLNHKVISAYTPIDILGLKWGLIAEVNLKEAFTSVVTIRNAIFIMTAISMILITFLAFSISGNLSNRISSIVEKLQSSTSQVAKSSESISSSSNQLSAASTKQASSLQETVSSIDEISSMVQRNSDSANTSAEVSKKSNDAANRGKEIVGSMINSISEISDSNNEIANEMQTNNEEISKIVGVIAEIGDKTKVINDIVFQTKLLSFNASVEAARAGEHGKGFAVVAEEVGNLASMSGKAALEITEMLDSSIKQVTEIVDNTKRKVENLVMTSKEKVTTGTKTAQECGEALDEILLNVSSVNEMVREIASASVEQSTGVKEVTRAMQEVDQTTHQNTAVAQQSSFMANDLKKQADGLNKVVNELLGVVNGGLENSEMSMFKDKDTLPMENTQDNIISISKEKSSKDTEVRSEHFEVAKASGSDLGDVPSMSDPRFEDL